MREPNPGHADRAAEDYVVAIATLEAEGKPVIGARLAEYFRVAPPTVTQTLQRLRDHGFVRLARPKGIALTASGRELAHSTLRRRRLAERFFVDALGMGLAEAEAEADRVEHVLSDEVAERLREALGDPETCPHGEPIDEDGVDAAFIATTLDRAPLGVDLVVERIGGETPGHDAAVAAIDAAGLLIGSRFVVRSRNPDQIELELGDERRPLTVGEARLLTVRQAQREGHPVRRDLAVARPDLRFHLTVKSVQGTCFAGHRVGQDFVVGHCAPAGLCLDALQKILPTLNALRLGRSNGAKVQVPCPEDGIVTFSVEPEPSGDVRGEPPRASA